MEVSGSNHLEHIAKLRWVETSQAGERAGNQTVYESTRAQMYEFVKNNREQAYAISRNDDKYAFLVAVDNGHVKYVRTEPDATRADNLLSLPRF
jgi:hypothetical protein